MTFKLVSIAHARRAIENKRGVSTDVSNSRYCKVVLNCCKISYLNVSCFVFVRVFIIVLPKEKDPRSKEKPQRELARTN